MALYLVFVVAASDFLSRLGLVVGLVEDCVVDGVSAAKINCAPAASAAPAALERRNPRRESD